MRELRTIENYIQLEYNGLGLPIKQKCKIDTLNFVATRLLHYSENNIVTNENINNIVEEIKNIENSDIENSARKRTFDDCVSYLRYYNIIEKIDNRNWRITKIATLNVMASEKDQTFSLMIYFNHLTVLHSINQNIYMNLNLLVEEYRVTNRLNVRSINEIYNLWMNEDYNAGKNITTKETLTCFHLVLMLFFQFKNINMIVPQSSDFVSNIDNENFYDNKIRTHDDDVVETFFYWKPNAKSREIRDHNYLNEINLKKVYNNLKLLFIGSSNLNEEKIYEDFDDKPVFLTKQEIDDRKPKLKKIIDKLMKKSIKKDNKTYTGYLGEVILYSFLELNKERVSNELKISNDYDILWNSLENEMADRDFTLISSTNHDEIIFNIECKTTNADNDYIYISKNEIELMNKNPNKYCVFFINLLNYDSTLQELEEMISLPSKSSDEVKLKEVLQKINEKNKYDELRIFYGAEIQENIEEEKTYKFNVNK